MEYNLPMDKKDIKHIFEKLIRARQVSNSPSTLTGEQDINKILTSSPKINKIVEDTAKHLEEKNDNQVLIYSNLVEGGVDTISKALDAKGIPHGIFAGKGRFKTDRDQAVQNYKKGALRVLVLSSAGKEGLDLGSTSMVALVDNTFNPEIENQAKARGIRIGGQAGRNPEDRKVVVKKYISTLPETLLNRLHITRPKNSVEEWVNSIAERKAKSNEELKQLLKQLKNKEGPVINPLPAPPDIGPIRRGGGLEFAVRRRKLRSDKGEDRMPYRPRRGA
jgi:ERCC4-related helicase